MRNIKIASKLIFLLVVVSLIPIAILITYSAISMRNSESSISIEGLDKTFKGEFDLFSSNDKNNAYILNYLANDPNVKGVYENKFGESTWMVKEFDNFRNAYSNIAGVFAILKDGKTYTSPSSFDISSYQDYNKAISSDGPIYTLFLNKNNAFKIVSEKIIGNSGNVDGVVGIYFNMKNIAASINSFKYGKSGELFLISPDNGKVLLSTDPADVGTNMGSQNWYANISSQSSGTVNYTLDGKSRYGIFGTLPSGAKVLMSATYGDIVSSANYDTLILIIIGIILAIIALIAGWLFGSFTISNPLKALIPKIERFASNDLTVDLSDNGKDEIAKLSNAFAEAVKARKNGLVIMKNSSDAIFKGSEDLNGIVHDTSNNVRELNAKTGSLSSESQNISASIEETSASVQEVASSAQNIANTIQEISEESQKISDGAEKGRASLESMKNDFSNIEGVSKETSESVKSLVELSNNVGQIVNEINKIAEQTNLLALNAAIEAARAGEAGKGFAVVADEIRKLAESSKNSTQRIAKILQDIVTRSTKVSDETSKSLEAIEKTSKSIEEVFEELKNIIEQVKNVSARIETVAAASQEESASSEEMASAMDTASKSIAKVASEVEGISEFGKKNEELVNELLALVENLKVQSEDLGKYVSGYKM